MPVMSAKPVTTKRPVAGAWEGHTLVSELTEAPFNVM